METNGCVCYGNWRLLVHRYEYLFGRRYKHKDDCFYFVGLVHSDDDYYYFMSNIKTGKYELLSCVGSPESFGFQLMDEI